MLKGTCYPYFLPTSLNVGDLNISGQNFRLLSPAILVYPRFRCCGFSANANFWLPQ